MGGSVNPKPYRRRHRRLHRVTLSLGWQVVFCRYRTARECGYGSVTYSPNRTAQSVSESSVACREKSLIPFVGQSPAGSQWVVFGFMRDARITQIEITLADGAVHQVPVQGERFYLLDGALHPGGPPPPAPKRAIGLDANGQVLAEWPGRP